ncbi:MAG: anti-sigma regulatory factor [Phycisphaerae bacterium]|nr:anti-sigma regulatory factor [Phycisphaerae bacterium]|tara:strand:+ start:535 stop:963 length:429 start_codon:yes stop_codon:yes gene_type:complete
MPDKPAHDAETGSVELTNNREEIAALEERVVGRIEDLGYPKSARFAVMLALEEAIANAFQHGHRDLPDDTPIQVTFRVTKDHVQITVEDRGAGFDPRDLPDPTVEENISNPSGRGMMLIRAYMSEVSHNDRGNRLSMTYRKP